MKQCHAYVVYHVNERLSIASLEASDNGGCLHVCDYRSNKRGKLVVWHGAADQALQGLFIGVEDERRIRTVIRVHLLQRQGRARIGGCGLRGFNDDTDDFIGERARCGC